MGCLDTLKLFPPPAPKLLQEVFHPFLHWKKKKSVGRK